MTADLRQAIEILQLSSLDIQALVRQELADNPCLEGSTEGDLGTSEGDLGLGQDNEQPTKGDEEWENVDWESASWQDDAPERVEADQFDDGTRNADSYFDLQGSVSDDMPLMRGHASGHSDDGNGWEAGASKAMSFQDYIRGQFDQMVPQGRLRSVGHFLIDALDEAGYLRIELSEAAARLGVELELVDDARALLQMLEPTGIGARDLPECLRLQLHASKKLTLAAEMCLLHLDRVAARDWAFLARKACCELNDVVNAVEAIRACNPKPGFSYQPQFAGSDSHDVVVPDVLVLPDDAAANSLLHQPLQGPRHWKVELNGAAFPRLVANPLDVAGYGKGRAATEAKRYASENFGKAKWLIGALEQRATNILKVARAIVAAQSQFLEAGPEFLVPLTMRQVAERIGVHESTVSRVSRGKYMQTPLGVFEFTTFFASGVSSTGGNVSVSSSSVQSMIARLVKEENPKKPLSDEQLVTKLKDEGVEIARRTVAKYRGILGIPGTSERRVRGR